MAKLGKRIKSAREGIERTKFYALDDALKLVKGRAKAKFDETIDIAMNLGVDPKHADQMVRGVCNLPNGSGRTVRVAVFARGAKAEEAQAAGADVVGAEDLVEQVSKGQINFDRCVATPDMMASCTPASARRASPNSSWRRTSARSSMPSTGPSRLAPREPTSRRSPSSRRWGPVCASISHRSAAHELSMCRAGPFGTRCEGVEDDEIPVRSRAGRADRAAGSSGDKVEPVRDCRCLRDREISGA
jgi:hypothetical protein